MNIHKWSEYIPVSMSKKDAEEDLMGEVDK